jgi:hypothetical protein
MKLVTNIQEPITNTSFNDLRQIVGTPFFSKNVNNRRASRKTVCFWFYILQRQIERIVKAEKITDRLASAARHDSTRAQNARKKC